MWTINILYNEQMPEKLTDESEWTVKHVHSPHVLASHDFDFEKFRTLPRLRFRLRDDDDNVYCEGFVSNERRDEDELLAPVDDFGVPTFGAIWMDILEEEVVIDRKVHRENGARIEEIKTVRSVWNQLNG